MPGLLMGLLQIGWFAVATSLASEFVLKAMGADSTPGSRPFIVTGAIWGGVFAWVGAKGIQYVARVSTFLNFIPLLMLIVVFSRFREARQYQPPAAAGGPLRGVTAMMATVIGFFATAGAAGADFGINARHETDVRWGGLVGVMLAPIVAGGLALAAVAMANGVEPQAAVRLRQRAARHRRTDCDVHVLSSSRWRRFRRRASASSSRATAFRP